MLYPPVCAVWRKVNQLTRGNGPVSILGYLFDPSGAYPRSVQFLVHAVASMPVMSENWPISDA